MRFTTRKHRNPPSVIIVSLIDVLIVVLIFMMVSSTFKQHPALRLALPESKQTQTPADPGGQMVVTIAREGDLYLGTLPVTLADLEARLKKGASQNADLKLSIRADTSAPFGRIVKVMDAAKGAGIKTVNAFTQTPPTK